MPPVKWKAPKVLAGGVRSTHVPKVLAGGVRSTHVQAPAATAKLLVAATASVAPSMLSTGIVPEGGRYHTTLPRRFWGMANATQMQAPVLESVQLTPRGGRRKHTLQRTSPGGTTRTAEYISPNKAEVVEDKGWEEGWDSDEEEELRIEYEYERWRRRCFAMEEVACQQTTAQRSAAARAKRKAGVPPAPPQAKRMCEYPSRVAAHLDSVALLQLHGVVARAMFE